jgi:murein DD-endopeptidase MepM/ murein hydrolase activator NlpD
LRALVCCILVGLALPAAASAHTDAGRQLSFASPVEGTITSPFGRDGYRWHSGLDIGILRSLTVRAASPGRVVHTGYVAGYEGYGNVVLLDLGSRYTALYAHLARPLVRAGQHLWTGQRLGIAGCTGWCTGTHLHFELRYRGLPINPLPLMTLSGLGSSAVTNRKE